AARYGILPASSRPLRFRVRADLFRRSRGALFALPMARAARRNRTWRDLAMTSLRVQAEIEAATPYVTRVASRASNALDHESDSAIVCEDADGIARAGRHGMVSLDGVGADDIAGDVLLVAPARGIVERLFRANAAHNTL